MRELQRGHTYTVKMIQEHDHKVQGEGVPTAGDTVTIPNKSWAIDSHSNFAWAVDLPADTYGAWFSLDELEPAQSVSGSE